MSWELQLKAITDIQQDIHLHYWFFYEWANMKIIQVSSYFLLLRNTWFDIGRNLTNPCHPIRVVEQGNYRMIVYHTESHGINAVYSVENTRVSSIMKLTMWYCVTSHGNYLVLPLKCCPCVHWHVQNAVLFIRICIWPLIQIYQSKYS